jgi:predicted RNase H-like HicB family nuclease
MGPTEYLRRPYGRVVVPEMDGTFHAEIVEFPGCIATGDTAAEALANLESVAESWLEATIAKGLHVPEPIENAGYSGKLVVRLAKTLHKKAAHAASRDGVSLNQFIVTCLAEAVGEKTREYFVCFQPRVHAVAYFGTSAEIATLPSSEPSRVKQITAASIGPAIFSWSSERQHA